MPLGSAISQEKELKESDEILRGQIIIHNTFIFQKETLIIISILITYRMGKYSINLDFRKDMLAQFLGSVDA